MLLKEEVSLCGYRAFKTQIDDVLVVLGKGMITESELKGDHVKPFTELTTALGHNFVVTQVKLNLGSRDIILQHISSLKILSLYSFVGLNKMQPIDDMHP